MKAIAIVLVAAGFVAGALISVLEVETVSWGPFVVALLAGFAGIIWYKRLTHAGISADEHVQGNLSTLGSALKNICINLDALVERRKDVPPHEFRFEIDRLFRDDLDAFAEARHSMQHAFGLRAYADIMSAFAAGERYINRVWTASADGYIDEVMRYLERAQRQFHEARDDFSALR
ncbi:MAG TPA: hypothetical protein VK064_09140 [Wenzhouxiangella sp.]|nr:hypothetical protein [Wenzhouxiangella sp.]